MSGRLTFLERFSLRGISLERILGFAFFQLWVTLMFNSIEPYMATDDVRGSLYLLQFISLATMAFSLLLISITVPKAVRISSSRVIVGSLTALMCMGTFCAVFADINTVSGMMYLSIGAILTGIGSGGLFMAWLERLFCDSGKLVFVELAIAFLFAFALGLVFIFLPSIVIVTIVLCLPLGSLAFLLRSGARGDAQKSVQLSAKSAVVNGDNKRDIDAVAKKQVTSEIQGVSKQAPDTFGLKQKLDAHDVVHPPLSGRSIWLFCKTLLGCFLFGMLEGFFDRLSGYRAYMVQDIYGVYLLFVGLIALAVVCIIAIVFRRDSVFYAYRFAMMLFCIGCLFTPFLSDNNTYIAGALIFAGYNCFLVLLDGICIDVARGFRLNPVKVIGIGMVALFVGEVAGMALERLFDSAIIPLDLQGITLVAVSMLFIGFLFLFNETDLVRIGIGDMDDVPAGSKRMSGTESANLSNRGAAGLCLGNADGSHAAGNINTRIEATSGIIAERFALSQRESDVLPLLLQGRTISRIQNTLFISAGTVSTHIRHIYQKTGANNRQELIDLLQEMIDSEKDTY